MPQAGQYIDPGTLQALQGLSSTQDDQNTLNQQMEMAQSLRAPQMPTNQMAGKVVIRQSPINALANVGTNMLSQYQQSQALEAMKANATKLRNYRGQLISKVAALTNAQNDPSKNHPDTNDTISEALAGSDPMANGGDY